MGVFHIYIYSCDAIAILDTITLAAALTEGEQNWAAICSQPSQDVNEPYEG